MQSITPELEALLKSKFQSGASGFRARVEVFGPSTTPVDTSGVAVASLVARYRLADAIGSGTAIDELGHNGTAEGDAFYNGCSLTVSGNSGSTFRSSTHSSLAPGTSGGTLMLWSSWPEALSAILRDQSGLDSDHPGWVVASRKTGTSIRNEILYRVGGGDIMTGLSLSFLSNRMTHYALAWSATGSALYIDGVRRFSGPAPGAEPIVLPWVYGKNGATSEWWAGRIADFRVFNARLSDADIAEIADAGSPCDPPLAADLTSIRPTNVSVDKSLNMPADQAEVSFANEDLPLGWGPASLFPTNSRIRIYQWYGEPLNEVRTFTGLIDRRLDSRDPLTTTISARSIMALLLDQTFTTIAPQSADEKESSNSTLAVDRTPANGVYLSMEAHLIVEDILDRAGWPSADRDITPTSYVLDEYILQDGWSWAEAIVGDDRITGYTGYLLWDDEQGVIHFGPPPAGSFTDPADPVYTFRTGEDIVSLGDETDQYDLITRVKVRGPLTTQTLNDTWRERWRTTKIAKPVGAWHDPSDAANVRVISRSTKRLYKVRRSDRAILSSVYLGGSIPYPLGLSGDPADASIYWVLNCPWIYTGSTSGNSVKKVRKSDNHVLASYAIPNGRWSAVKASSTHIWLTNLDTDKFYKRTKTLAAVASYRHTFNSVLQSNPSGMMIDGTTLSVFWSNGGTTARFLQCSTSAPSTVTKVVKTAGTSLHGGEMDTVTHLNCFGVSDSLNLTAEFTLLEAVDQTNEVYAEVIDQDLEDELGSLAHMENREHDSHPAAADHAFEVRRRTLDLSAITSLAQATETAQRVLDAEGKRRRVLDAGCIGNPAIQKTDVVAVVDDLTGISETFTVDTYRSSMDAGGTYLGTLALLPLEAFTDAPEDDGSSVDDPGIVVDPTPDPADPGADD